MNCYFSIRKRRHIFRKLCKVRDLKSICRGLKSEQFLSRYFFFQKKVKNKQFKYDEGLFDNDYFDNIDNDFFKKKSNEIKRKK